MNLRKCLATLVAASSCFAIASSPAHAGVIKFDNTGIMFDTDTNVDFSFLESNGYYASTFGVAQATNPVSSFQSLFTEKSPGYDLDKNGKKIGDYRGSCGATVAFTSGTQSCTKTFTFLKNIDYTLALQSISNDSDKIRNRGTVYSTTALNTGNFAQQATFIAALMPKIGINFEDNAYKLGKNIDFNDFKVTAQIQSVPEPATLGALGLVTGALLLSQRRKSAKAV